MSNQSTFVAGRLKHFLPVWQELTCDHTILQWVTGVKIEFINNNSPTCENIYPQQRSTYSADAMVVRTELQKLLNKGVIMPSAHEEGEIISPIFVRPKKDGTYRLILNLKQLNQYIEYHHFKMDTLGAAVGVVRPGCCMASVDLKDAYYTVAVHSEHQKYLKFIFDGTLYQYTCLPNGLSSAPRLFTKLLKPVYATLHSMGHLNSGYIDDSYLQGDSFGECTSNVTATAHMMSHVGFTLHPEKSVFIPTQAFLGFILNSIDMSVSPTPERISKTISSCNRLLQTSGPSIQFVSEVIGILVSNLPGVEFGQLHYRSLEIDKILALKTVQGNYNATMQLSCQSTQYLLWWVKTMPTAKKPIARPNPSKIIQSDASKLGWGAVCDSQKTGGRWAPDEGGAHINYLELLAAFLALKTFCSADVNIHVQLHLDNTTAIAYLNNMGGTKSTELNSLSIQIWEWCIQKSLWVSAVHIAGKLNCEADYKSRVFNDKHEYMLNKAVFQLNLDMFASRLNKQLDDYASWNPDPECKFVDAFSVNWKAYNFYAFQPFSLIPRCLQKIQQDKATGIMIIPLWPTQAWFPLVLQMLYNQPWILLPRETLLQDPATNQPHPLHQKLHLMVCPVSGNPSIVSTFLQKLPISLCSPGAKELRNSTTHTLTNGWNFVVKGRFLTIHQR